MRSPATAPTPVPVEVEGGTLATFRYGAPDAPPSRTVVAVHGITASSRAWPAVARALPEDWALVAVDLRGPRTQYVGQPMTYGFSLAARFGSATR